MDTLKEILLSCMKGYAGKGLNSISYLTENDKNNVFTVVDIAQLKEKRIVDNGLVVRLINDRIIIEHDINDKPLVDALVQAGVSREKIVLAYAGEATQSVYELMEQYKSPEVKVVLS
jgi:hypothetical protein